MLAKKTAKNQITLPKKVADQFPATDYFDVRTEGGEIVLRPVDPDALRRVQRKLAELGIRERDVRAAVAWARKG
jgi:AbrB family looped-hinge helix DNA binding protein